MGDRRHVRHAGEPGELVKKLDHLRDGVVLCYVVYHNRGGSIVLLNRYQ